MLAVSGKQAVAAYYSLFKQLAPELRVAMTYSRDEANGTGASDLQAALKQAMQDYMTFYGTRNFLEDKDPQRAYLNDMTKRIARKKPYNKGNDADRLDLIIVSDQLLTGFDSKFVNIINMSSILGLVGDTMTASYNASKGAVRLFSKSAAVYAAQNDLNIRVNTVHLVYIATPLTDGSGEGDSVAPYVTQRLKKPMGLMGEPDDIAWICVYLASDESKFATGAEFVIDGGYTAQ